ncbi:MAG: DUF2970 domain-containing protein [Nitrosospira sp.]|nr:DUF2970 domain-containing protein [Nitrosospira sp.]
MKEKKAKLDGGKLLQISGAVFWAFFGVRKQSDLELDASTLTPAQVIIGGIVGAALFVGSLMLLVSLVTS